MSNVDTLLTEINALAPAGASVSVSETVWSHEGGARVTREWSASVHVDGMRCPHGEFDMVAHEHSESAAQLIAQVSARLAEMQCVCSRCCAARELARLESHDVESEPEVVAAYRAWREIIEAIPAKHMPVEPEDVCPDEYQAYLTALHAAEERHAADLERARARAA